MLRPIALMLAASSLAACAPTGGSGSTPAMSASEPGGGRQCFAPGRIANFTSGAPGQVYVRVLGGGTFSIRSANCPEISTAASLSVTPELGGRQLCVGDTARVLGANSAISPSLCVARVERSLTAADIQALPANQRP